MRRHCIAVTLDQISLFRQDINSNAKHIYSVAFPPYTVRHQSLHRNTPTAINMVTAIYSKESVKL